MPEQEHEGGPPEHSGEAAMNASAARKIGRRKKKKRGEKSPSC
jgi:hypothetical protein